MSTELVHRYLRLLLLALTLAIPALTLAPHAQAATAEQKAAAKEKKQAEARLKALRKEVAALNKDLRKDRRGRSKNVSNLADVELKIGKARREVGVLERELKNLGRQRTRVDLALEKQQQLVAAHKEALRTVLRSAYANGGREPFKLMLNQNSAAEAGRMLAYYQFLNRERQQRMAVYQEKVDSLAEGRSELLSIEAEIAAKTEARKLELRKLEGDRNRRKTVLAKVDREIGAQGGQEKRLKQEAARLEKTIARLQKIITRVPKRKPRPKPKPKPIAKPVQPQQSSRITSATVIQPQLDQQLRSNGQPFYRQAGKLPWPSKGRWKKPEFGRLRGIIIEAPRNTPVRAVADGEVVFSDWLQRFGLVVVVDHGDGYMSLYGHNASLHSRIGQRVRAGDIIAKVGDSGGMKKNALYFELRLNKTVLSARKWLRRRG